MINSRLQCTTTEINVSFRVRQPSTWKFHPIIGSGGHRLFTRTERNGRKKCLCVLAGNWEILSTIYLRATCSNTNFPSTLLNNVQKKTKRKEETFKTLFLPHAGSSVFFHRNFPSRSPPSLGAKSFPGLWRCTYLVALWCAVLYLFGTCVFVGSSCQCPFVVPTTPSAIVCASAFPELSTHPWANGCNVGRCWCV